MTGSTTSTLRAERPSTADRRRRNLAGSAVVVAAMVLTVLVTNAGAAPRQSPPPRPATRQAHPVIIDSAKHGSLGVILVTSGHYTLYYDKADTPSKIACTGGCTQIWPPILLPKGVSSATAGPGVAQKSLGVVHRGPGKLQVTYAGHPLYRFVQDAAPGQVKGEGVGGFYVVKADLKKASSSGGGGSTTTTPYGRGY